MTLRLNNFRALVLALGLTVRLPAADPAKTAAKAMQQSVAQQRHAVASMAVSLEAQRRSLHFQMVRLPAPPLSSVSSLAPLQPVPPLSIPGVPLSESCPPLPATELDALVDDAAQREELEPDLIRSIIRQESAARPCAVSSKGAMGLMQLMPATALQFGVADAFDPKENVTAGTRLLKQLLTLYGGDVSLALGAFNAGPGKISQAGGLPDYPETLDYVQKVLSSLPEQH